MWKISVVCDETFIIFLPTNFASPADRCVLLSPDAYSGSAGSNPMNMNKKVN